ncbi:MAG: phenylalanine--tRNA ligase subunit beta, partial [Pseudomonadota bacterium]
QGGTLTQRREVAFALTGARAVEHWDHGREALDLHDAVGHIEALLALRGARSTVRTVAGNHLSLHPGQCASILADDEHVGTVGVLHPARARALDLPLGVVLAVLDFELAFRATLPQYTAVSRFPATRRDLSIVVDEAVTADALRAAINEAAGAVLQTLRIFDIYRGKGIDSGRKSVSFGLILQDSSRTLNDDEADAVTAAVIARIKQEFDGAIRE